MPTPLKPCEGKISDDTLEALRRNRNREQWATHPCEICGRVVGVELIMGKWHPERHWPSVAYVARKASANPRPAGPSWQSTTSHPHPIAE